MELPHRIAVPLLWAVLSLALGCSHDSAEYPPGISGPGWQHSADMYEAADYHWNDLTSVDQLAGNWYGSKIIHRPAIANVCPSFDVLVRLKLVHVGTSTTLSTISEDQYYNDAILKGADWEKLKSALADTPTGTKINPTYPPLISDSDRTTFYGDASSIPGVRWEREYWVELPIIYPPFVKDLSAKVSDDGTKLLFQYSDDLQFVIGKE